MTPTDEHTATKAHYSVTTWFRYAVILMPEHNHTHTWVPGNPLHRDIQYCILTRITTATQNRPPRKPLPHKIRDINQTPSHRVTKVTQAYIPPHTKAPHSIPHKPIKRQTTIYPRHTQICIQSVTQTQAGVQTHTHAPSPVNTQQAHPASCRQGQS